MGHGHNIPMQTHQQNPQSCSAQLDFTQTVCLRWKQEEPVASICSVEQLGMKIACKYEQYGLNPPLAASLIRPSCALQHLGNMFIRPNVDAFRFLPATIHYVAGSCGTVVHNAKSTPSTCETVSSVCYSIHLLFICLLFAM